MDDETNKLLRQILIVQQDQTAILKRYLPPLWNKIRFSLLALLTLMTITAIGMGLVVYKTTSTKPAGPGFPPPAKAVRPSRSPRQGMPPQYEPPKTILPPSVPKSPVATTAKELPAAQL